MVERLVAWQTGKPVGKVIFGVLPDSLLLCQGYGQPSNIDGKALFVRKLRAVIVTKALCQSFDCAMMVAHGTI